MRILVPLDGSSFAEQALESAAALARQTPDPVTLILVRASPYPPSLVETYAPLSLPEAFATGEEICHDYLHQIQQRTLLRGLKVAIVVATGNPTAVICDIVRQQDIDLIMMTSHSRSGVVQSLWGSVAQAVVRESGVPTLIIRQHTTTLFTGNQAHSFTMVVPLDGTVLAEAILPAAVRIAKSCHAILYLVRIVPPMSAIEAIHQAADYLEYIQQWVEAQGVTVNITVQQGTPTVIVEQMVRQRQPALVAIATHGRAGLDQIFHGSTTQRLWHDLTLPLLVLHPTPTPEDATLQAILTASWQEHAISE